MTARPNSGGKAVARNETGKKIRIRPETDIRFRAALERLRQAWHEGKCKADWDGELTADVFVNILLDARDAHRERSERARRNAHKRRAVEGLDSKSSKGVANG
jgi:hypothetical protein